jgi:1,4-alpha-glucan branching enzyme
MYTQPGKNLLFMGCDIAQWQEWSEARSLDWHLLQWEPHRKLQAYVADLNRIYTSEPALYERDYDHRGFEWIDLHDSDNSILTYLRRASDPDEYIVIVCNFTPVARFGYRVGVPEGCVYRELLNSDADVYWGSNLGNAGGFAADPMPWQGRPYSLNLTLPPLSVSFFKPEREGSSN